MEGDAQSAKRLGETVNKWNVSGGLFGKGAVQFPKTGIGDRKRETEDLMSGGTKQ